MDIYNTPTFYINGRQVVGDRPFEDLSRIIDEELAQAGR
jgi:protein-disulfide isomerase